jgi:polyisoprenoid-binding protein YceI
LPAAPAPAASMSPSATPTSAPAQDVSWCVDVQRSTLQVAGADRVLGEHVGTVGRFSGELQTTGQQVRSLRVEFDLTTLRLESSLVEDFVKSTDFMDVERFPSAVFETTQLRLGSGAKPGEVVGDLTLHGHTKTFRFPVEVTLGDAEGVIKANVLLPRRAFEIYPRKKHWDFFISPDFRVALDLTIVSARKDGARAMAGAALGACGNVAKAQP